MCAARPARGADTDGLAALVGRIGRALPDPGPIGVPDPEGPLRAFRHLPFHRALAAAGEFLGGAPGLGAPAFRGLLLRGRITRDDLDAALRGEDEIEGRSDEPRFGGALSSRAVRRLALLHEVDPPPPAVLRWRLQEDALAARLPADVPRAAATRLVDEGRVSLSALLTGGQVPALLAALSGETDAARAVAVIGPRLGLRAGTQDLPRLLLCSPEAAVASALWEACRRLVTPMGEAGDGTLRDLVLRASGEDIYARVHPLLARTCAAYFGSGAASGAMPDRALGLYRSARRALDGAGATEAWLREAAADFRGQDARGLDAAQALRESLAALCVPVAARGRFLRRAALALPGWPGLICRLTRDPSARPPASLLDFLAVRLVLERAALAETARRTLGHEGPLAELGRADRGTAGADAVLARTYRLFRVLCLAGVPLAAVTRAGAADARAVLSDLAQFDDPARRRVFQSACDHHHRAEIFAALAAHPTPAETAPPRFQILCCFDAREEPLRRALEALGPDIETFGVAGFSARLRPPRRGRVRTAPPRERLTTEAQAQRVAALLEDAGLARGVAPIVAVIAHGAPVPGSPPAQTCDACSVTGARRLVALANRPAVRAALRGRGLELSDETLFVAAVRDPGTGAISLTGPSRVPGRHRAAVRELAAALEQARTHASRPVPAPAAAVCIVGRRARTRGLHLDGRALLVSYDAAADPRGAILARVLAAAVPASVRRNLACFAPADGRGGSAAEHPPPVRMLLVVEAAPDPLRAALGRLPALRALVQDRWLWLASLHPETGALRLVDDSGDFG